METLYFLILSFFLNKKRLGGLCTQHDDNIYVYIYEKKNPNKKEKEKKKHMVLEATPRSCPKDPRRRPSCSALRARPSVSSSSHLSSSSFFSFSLVSSVSSSFSPFSRLFESPPPFAPSPLTPSPLSFALVSSSCSSSFAPPPSYPTRGPSPHARQSPASPAGPTRPAGSPPPPPSSPSPPPPPPTAPSVARPRACTPARAAATRPTV